MNKTVLILIDIQNDYFPEGKVELYNSVGASKNAKKILDIFREKELPIIHIKHEAIRKDATFFIPNTKGAQIHDNVKPTSDEIVVIKNYPNSFRETNLLKILLDLKVENLVICGMMTHMCVDATTRAAKDFGFNCILIGDACATKDLEINKEYVNAKDVQNAFLSALNYFYSTVINTKEYILNSDKYC